MTDELHVVDLAPATHEQLRPAIERTQSSALVVALRDAAETLRDGVHVGLRHAPASFSTRLSSCASQLAAVGLRSTAERVQRTQQALGDAQSSGEHASEQRLTLSWVDAMLRLSVCEEAL